MSGEAAIVGALLPPALELLRGLIESATGEQDLARIREGLAELTTRLDAVPLPSAVAGAVLGRALEERRAAAAPASRIDPRSLGQVAFDAYRVARGGKNHDGTPTPTWDAVGDGVRDGWEASARAALDAAGR